MATHAHYPGEFGYKPRKAKIVGGKIQKRDKIAKIKAAQAKHMAMSAKKKSVQQKRYEGFTAKQKKLGSKTEKAFAKSDKKKKAYDAKRDKLVGKIASAKSETKKAALRAKLKAHEAKKNAHHDSTAKAIEKQKRVGDALQKKKEALRKKMDAYRLKSEAKQKKFDEKIGKKSKASDGQEKSEAKSKSDQQKLYNDSDDVWAFVNKSQNQTPKSGDEKARKSAKLKKQMDDIKAKKVGKNLTDEDKLKASIAKNKDKYDSMSDHEKLAYHMKESRLANITGDKVAMAKASDKIDALNKKLGNDFSSKSIMSGSKHDGITPDHKTGVTKSHFTKHETLSDADFHSERQRYTDSLSPSQKKSVLAYSGEDYTAINGHLRGVKKDSYSDLTESQVKKHVAEIDAALESPAARAPRDMLVFRGVPGKSFPIQEGGVYQDKGFISTSQKAGVAKGFGQGTVFHIEIPKGFPAAAIPSSNSTENEHLLPRGTRFKIKSVNDDATGSRIVVMTPILG